MPLPTPADIFAELPGLDEREHPDRVQRYINRAVLMTNEAEWQPAAYPVAITYLTLHFLDGNPVASNVQSLPNGMAVDPSSIKSIEATDEFSISFHSPKDIGNAAARNDGTLASSKWGRMYLELKALQVGEVSSATVSFGRGQPSKFDVPLW